MAAAPPSPMYPLGGRHTSFGYGAAVPPRSSTVPPRLPDLTAFLTSSDPQSQEQLYSFVESGSVTPDVIRTLSSRESKLLMDRLDEVSSTV